MSEAGRSVNRSSVVRAWYRFQGMLIFFALVASLAATALSAILLWRATRENTIVTALMSGQDRDVSARRDGGQAVAAKHYFLLQRDLKDEAQTLLDAASPRLEDSVKARVLFNHANSHVRGAIQRIEKGDLDGAIPLVMLAKEQYRQAMRIDPAAWDVKHNYDVAMRLVRDFPGYESEGEETPPDAPKRLWTDLPGVPRGEP